MKKKECIICGKEVEPDADREDSLYCKCCASNPYNKFTVNKKW